MTLIERYNIARDREAEAHLRTPQGEAERRLRNALAVERARQEAAAGLGFRHFPSLEG